MAPLARDRPIFGTATPPRTLAACDDFIRAVVQKQPEATLDELCRQVAEA
ncbi:MAG: hypothetical protein NZM11_04735 [Anaerolineales bacterium]|nr:hypothetical protein [Anaerolineales bacterium]